MLNTLPPQGMTWSQMSTFEGQKLWSGLGLTLTLPACFSISVLCREGKLLPDGLQTTQHLSRPATPHPPQPVSTLRETWLSVSAMCPSSLKLGNYQRWPLGQLHPESPQVNEASPVPAHLIAIHKMASLRNSQSGGHPQPGKVVGTVKRGTRQHFWFPRPPPRFFLFKKISTIYKATPPSLHPATWPGQRSHPLSSLSP